MGTSSNWFNVIRRKFVKKSPRDIIVVYSNTSSNSQVEIIATEQEETANLLHAIAIARASSASQTKVLKQEDIAATKIQAQFRGHLARRAFRALRSLVKLQAMVRGAHVRKQARIALHCMHALVRLQVSVRARQLLQGGCDDRSSVHNTLC